MPVLQVTYLGISFFQMDLRRNCNHYRSFRPKSRTFALSLERGAKAPPESSNTRVTWTARSHSSWDLSVLSPNNLARHMVVPMQKPHITCLSILLLLSPTLGLCLPLRLYQKRRGRRQSVVPISGLQLSLPNSFTSVAHRRKLWTVCISWNSSK